MAEDHLRSRKTGQKEAFQESETRDKPDQKMAHQKIYSQGTGALVCAALVLTIGYLVLPVPTGLSSLTDRLVYTIRWQLPSVLLLVSAIQKVADTRFNSSALNPVEGDQSHVTVYKNFLTNTFEQYVLHLLAMLVLTTFLSERQMILVPLLELVFVAGRIFFWWGYQDPSLGYSNRAFGFVMTFGVTALVLLYCVYRFLWDLVL